MTMIKDCTFTYRGITDRKRKNLAILDSIRRKGEISRTDISKETDINIVSVSNYITSYLKKGLVLECGLDTSTGGRRPELVKLNLENAYVVGLDIGSENIVAIVTDLGLRLKTKIVIPRPEGNMEKVIEASLDFLQKLFKEFGKPISEIKLIGIGASGIVDIYSGVIHDTNPERGKTKASFLNMAHTLEKKFNITSLVGNDATCAAFGELSLTADTDIGEMLYIYSDVGCGIIINRDIYCGASGSAGEVQLVLDRGEAKKIHATEIASYGVRGIDLGVVKQAKKLIEKGKETEILKFAGNNKDAITKEVVFAAANKGDKLAKELIAESAYWLGTKVAYLINVFNPQLVIIGGGMEKAGNIFMEPLITCVKIYAFDEAFNTAKIMPSFLAEDAIALGAASLAVRELFINA